MNPQGIITIDLTQYGGEGTIEMGMPTLRRRTETNTELGRYAKPRIVNGKTVMDEGMDLGMLDIVSVLLYVRKAPFKLNAESFLDFCDTLDTEEVHSTELFEEMQKISKEISSGVAGSPFVYSQHLQTGSSE